MSIFDQKVELFNERLSFLLLLRGEGLSLQKIKRIVIDDIGEESGELLVGASGRGKGRVGEGEKLFTGVLFDVVELLCAETVSVFFVHF